jgi:hypothetical protein
MRDVNKLIPSGSPRLAFGIGINNRGEILCGGVNEKGLYLLVPLPTLSIQISEAPAGRKIVVEAQTIPGRSYRLESSPDLKNWTAVGTAFIADQATSREFETGNDPSPLFYRVAGPL